MWKEAYWANAIKDYVAIPVAHIGGELVETGDASSATAEVCLLPDTRERIAQLVENNDLDSSTLLLAFFSSFLTRSERSVVPIWYTDPDYRRDATGMTNLVSPFALCRMKVDDECGMIAHYGQTAKQLSDVKKMRHFLFDITSRYPQLRGGRSFDELQQCAFAFHGVNGQDDWSIREAFELSVEVMGDVSDFSMAVNVARGGSGRALRFAEQLSTHIDAIVSNPDTPLHAHELRRCTVA
jgi:hypothetical protein